MRGTQDSCECAGAGRRLAQTVTAPEKQPSPENRSDAFCDRF